MIRARGSHRGGRFLAIPTGFNAAQGRRGRGERGMRVTPAQMVASGQAFLVPFGTGRGFVWCLPVRQGEQVGRRRARMENGRMTSAREAALVALRNVLAAALAPRAVLRNETIPQRIPTGGLVVVQDGETVEETPLLSPLRWQVRHVAEVAVVVAGATPAARGSALDALLVEIATAIVADRTLGGAVEWAQPESPSFDDIESDGAASLRGASVPVSLWFTTSETPLS